MLKAPLIAAVFCFPLILFSKSQDKQTYVQSFNLDSEFAAGYGAVDVDYRFARKNPKEISFQSISLAAGGDQTKYKDEVTQETTITKSKRGSFALDFEIWKGLGLGFKYHATSSSETEYQQNSSIGRLGYHSQPGEEDLLSWGLGLTYGESTIQQKLKFSILNSTIERNVELRGKETGFDFNFEWDDRWAVSFGGSQYSYSKSKTELQTAYRNRFLNSYATGVVSTIGGLPESKSFFSLGYSFDGEEETGNYFELSYAHEQSKTIVDEMIEFHRSLQGEYFLEKWSLRAGVAQSATENTKDNSLLMGLGFQL